MDSLGLSGPTSRQLSSRPFLSLNPLNSRMLYKVHNYTLVTVIKAEKLKKRMKETAGSGTSNEFTIDRIESLSIRNNWCSWCVNVFISDPNGDWNSCGTGLLSFYGVRRDRNAPTKISLVKDLKDDLESWETNKFILQVRSKKNLANNNKGLSINQELKKKLTMDGSDDLILQCPLKKAT